MKRVNLLAASIFVLGQTLAGGAVAAPVILSGTTVDFSFDDALLGLFGMPVLSANDTLVFTPVGFDAQAFNGPKLDLTNQTMNIRVTAKQGFEIGHVGLLERGDYLLEGAASSVDVTGQLRMFDLNNQAVSFTDSIVAAAPLTIQGLPTHNWTATAGIAVNPAMYDLTHANVAVENLLIARAFSVDSLAFIEKKELFLNVNTLAVTPVPEAETYAMMLAGLGLVGFMVNRRRTLR